MGYAERYTPAGPLTELKLLEPTFNTGATHEHFIKEPEDYHKLLAISAGTPSCSRDTAQFLRDQQDLGASRT